MEYPYRHPPSTADNSTVTRLSEEKRLDAIKHFHDPAPPACSASDDTMYPTIRLDRSSGLHNLKPGRHGYALVASTQIVGHLESSRTFTLVVDGRHYGKYQAKPLIDHPLHGIEFLNLKEQVKVDVIEALSLSKPGTSRYSKCKEDILMSKRTVPRFSFRCVEQPDESPVVEFAPRSLQRAFDYREERRWAAGRETRADDVPALSRSYSGRGVLEDKVVPDPIEHWALEGYRAYCIAEQERRWAARR